MHCGILPDELILQIFKWLPFHHRVSVLPKVCKRWHSLARDTSLFRIVDLRRVELDESKSDGLVPFLQTVRPHRLVLNQLDKTVLEAFCASTVLHWTSLTSLEISNGNVDDDLIARLCIVLPHLTYLGLQHCFRVTDKSAILIAQSLSNLRGLDLSCAKPITDRGVGAILKQHGPQLEILYWQRVNCLRHSLKYLKSCRSLKVLHLPVHIISNLPGRPRIYDIDDRFLEALQNFRNLQELSIEADTNFSAESMRKSLANLPQLRHLSLWEIRGFGDEEVEIICRNCPDLETLILFDCNEISDNSLAHIAQHCHKLVVLKISMNDSITGEQLLQFNLKELLPKLFLIDFRFCAFVSSNFCDSLAVHNPQLVVVDREARLPAGNDRYAMNLSDQATRQVLKEELESRVSCHDFLKLCDVLWFY